MLPQYYGLHKKTLWYIYHVWNSCLLLLSLKGGFKINDCTPYCTHNYFKNPNILLVFYPPHHLIFGFFISFSQCNIVEIYKIECPVCRNRVSEIWKPGPSFSWVVFLPFILEARSVMWFCVRDAQTWRLLRTNTISWWKERRRSRCFGSPRWSCESPPFHSS